MSEIRLKSELSHPCSEHTCTACIPSHELRKSIVHHVCKYVTIYSHQYYCKNLLFYIILLLLNIIIIIIITYYYYYYYYHYYDIIIIIIQALLL